MRSGATKGLGGSGGNIGGAGGMLPLGPITGKPDSSYRPLHDPAPPPVSMPPPYSSTTNLNYTGGNGYSGYNDPYHYPASSSR